MSRFKSTTWKAMMRRQKIESYFRHKALADMIPENENIFRAKIQHSLKITLKFNGEPQMTLTTDFMPFGGWSISPTSMGKKIQQAMIGFEKSDKPLSPNNLPSQRKPKCGKSDLDQAPGCH